MIRSSLSRLKARNVNAVRLTPTMYVSQESYTEKQQRLGRPVAPHVTIYKFPMAAVSSITNRITGIALSVGTTSRYASKYSSHTFSRCDGYWRIRFGGSRRPSDDDSSRVLASPWTDCEVLCIISSCLPLLYVALSSFPVVTCECSGRSAAPRVGQDSRELDQ